METKTTTTMRLFSRLLDLRLPEKLTMDGCDNESAACFIRCHVALACPIDECGGTLQKVEIHKDDFFINKCDKCGTRKKIMFNTPLENWRHGVGKGVFVIIAWLWGEPYENIKKETKLSDNILKRLISKLEEYDLNDLPSDTNLNNAVIKMQIKKREKQINK